MASEKQIMANQLNAKKSTGPKTKSSKSVVSRNAIKHGLLSIETLLPWENKGDFLEMKDGLLKSLTPETDLDQILIDRLTSIIWRLRRVGRIETGIFAMERYSINYKMCQKDDALKILDEDSSVTHLKTVSEMDQHSDFLELGIIFSENAGNLSNLNRYESSLERSLFKTLHEIQRLKAIREGLEIPESFAIDVNHDLEKKD